MSAAGEPDVAEAHDTDSVAPSDTTAVRSDTIPASQDAVAQGAVSAVNRASSRSSRTTSDSDYARRQASRSASRERRYNRHRRPYRVGDFSSPPCPDGRQSDRLAGEDYVDDPIAGLCAALASLLESGDSSDFIIKTKTKNIKVHKFIIRQSPVFRAACDGSFKEALEGVIDLTAEDERLLDIIIKWMYGDYGVCHGSNNEALTIFDIIHLRETAARLGVHSLVRATIRDFTYCLEDRRRTSWPDSLEDLATALYDDTTTSCKALRTAFVSYVVERLSECGQDERTTIEQVIQDHDSNLVADVAVRLTDTIRRLNHTDSSMYARRQYRARYDT